MRLIEKTASAAALVSAWVAGAVLLLMMAQVSLDVALKYLLNWPIPMTLETVSAYYMAALVFLPLGLATRDGDHLEVELFTAKLAPRPLAWVKLFGCIFGMIYVGIIVSETVAEAAEMTGRGEVWETATVDLPAWPARWFLPVGAALMWVWLALQAIDHLTFAAKGRRWLTPRAPHDPATDSAS